MSEQSLRPSAAAQVLAYVGETISIMNYVRNTKFKMAEDNCEMQRISAEQAGIAAYNDAYNQGSATQLQAIGQIASAGVSLGGDLGSYAYTYVNSKIQQNTLNKQLSNVESWEKTLNNSSHEVAVYPVSRLFGDEESPKTFFNRIKQGDLTSRGPNENEIEGLHLHSDHEEFEKLEKRLEKVKTI